MKPPLSEDDLRALMVRYNQLGCLLPAEHDLDTDDPVAMAEARLVLQEMALVKSEIDGFLTEAKSRMGQA